MMSDKTPTFVELSNVSEQDDFTNELDSTITSEATPAMVRHRLRGDHRRPNSGEEIPAFLYSARTWVIGEEIDWIPSTQFGWEHYTAKPQSTHEFNFTKFRRATPGERLIDVRFYLLGQLRPNSDLFLARQEYSGAWRGNRTVVRSTDEVVRRFPTGCLETYEPFLEIRSYSHLLFGDNIKFVIRWHDKREMHIFLKYGKRPKKNI